MNETTTTAAAPTRSRGRLVIVPLAGLLVAAAVAVGSGADFVSNSVNTANAFSTGTLSQQNSKADKAIFDLANLKPGDTLNGSVTITNSGSLPALFTLRHGRGEITVSGTRRAEYVTVQVSDEGPRPSGNQIFHRRPEQRSASSGERIGLALSAELAESLGGHLLLEGTATTRFSLILPARA